MLIAFLYTIACNPAISCVGGLDRISVRREKRSNGYRVKAVMSKLYSRINDSTLPPTRGNRWTTFLTDILQEQRIPKWVSGR